MKHLPLLLAALLFALAVLPSCASTNPMNMPDLEFGSYLVDVHNDTALLASGWVHDNQSDLDELRTVAALLVPANGEPITPEQLANLEDNGFIAAVVSTGLKKFLAGVDDAQRARDIIKAFAKGLQTAIDAASQEPA